MAKAVSSNMLDSPEIDDFVFIRKETSSSEGSNAGTPSSLGVPSSGYESCSNFSSSQGGSSSLFASPSTCSSVQEAPKICVQNLSYVSAENQLYAKTKKVEGLSQSCSNLQEKPKEAICIENLTYVSAESHPQAGSVNSAKFEKICIQNSSYITAPQSSINGLAQSTSRLIPPTLVKNAQKSTKIEVNESQEGVWLIQPPEMRPRANSTDPLSRRKISKEFAEATSLSFDRTHENLHDIGLRSRTDTVESVK